ncbi:MAG: IS200/IS605 family transposase [Planctomycetaceae bacterium]|nr:IS200/IS605 family transposase [Planctomycetaceae bacterium]
MGQSLSKVLVHLIFSTKNRQALLADSVREELKAYLIGILRNLDSPSLQLEAVEDHVHILFLLSRKTSQSEIVEHLKTASSKWIKTKGRQYAGFHWQNGYGAFSVSESSIRQVRDYILNQPEHHEKISFQDEYRAFLKRHNIEYDERYVWD